MDLVALLTELRPLFRDIVTVLLVFLVVVLPGALAFLLVYFNTAKGLPGWAKVGLLAMLAASVTVAILLILRGIPHDADITDDDPRPVGTSESTGESSTRDGTRALEIPIPAALRDY